MSASIQPIRTQSFCSSFSRVAEVVIQTAIRVIFVIGSILATAAAFPLSWHSFTIPAAGFAAAILAGFFFPEPKAVSGPYFQSDQPLISQTAPTDGAPRLLKNAGNNCAFNSIVHFMECDPELARWWRTPLTPQIDLETFIAFLNTYEPPERLIEDFRAYHQAQEDAARPIPDQFSAFLAEYQPPEEDRIKVNEIRTNYDNLRKLQGPFSRFFRAMDRAVQEGQAVCRGSSQALRLALNQVTDMVDPSPRVQMDAAELLTYICEVLPPSMQNHVEVEHHLDTRGFPNIDPGEPPVRQQKLETILNLPMQNEPSQNLNHLLEQYCDSSNVEMSVKRKDVEGNVHNYPVSKEINSFLEPPRALRIQLRRFQFIPEVQSFWSSWFPKIFPPIPAHTVKITHPVEIPEILSIQAKNGQVQRYQLAGYILHIGNTPRSGHYTAGCTRDGRRFIMNDDHEAILVEDEASRARWQDEVSRAYMLSYLPIEDPAMANPDLEPQGAVGA